MCANLQGGPYVLLHITAQAQAVLEQGLKPRMGPRAVACGEPEPGIWCFTSVDALSDALLGWAGEAFDEDASLALLAVRPEFHHLFSSRPDTAFEAFSAHEIAPQGLVLLCENIDQEASLDWLTERLAALDSSGDRQGRCAPRAEQRQR